MASCRECDRSVNALDNYCAACGAKSPSSPHHPSRWHWTYGRSDFTLTTAAYGLTLGAYAAVVGAGFLIAFLTDQLLGNGEPWWVGGILGAFITVAVTRLAIWLESD